MSVLLDLWDEFCGEHTISVSSVPLFDADEAGVVATFGYGRNERLMLRRSGAMEAKLIDTVNAVLSAPATKYEGILYMMHRIGPAGRVVPLYIGRAGRHGDAQQLNVVVLKARFDVDVNVVGCVRNSRHLEIQRPGVDRL